ncbi:MAG: 2-hydroxyacyl-CoA dehydratase [Gemmatimonadetes bacterium]|nr:2-hydroxyacyl-CoA dehydratase [Gemmatimonadota bacterium]
MTTAGPTVLASVRELADRTWNDPEFRALGEFRARGPHARVIGCFPVYTPEEIVHAAGFLPAHIFGGGHLVEIERADSRIQSFVCSICRSTLELALTGKLDALDGFIFPSICDVARNLSGVWRRNFPDRWVAYVHWPENVRSRHARDYLLAEFQRLAAGLEELRGQPLGPAELNASIAVYNRNRDLIRELYALRRQHPEKLGLAETYSLVRAGGFMPREEHTKLLASALEDSRARDAQPRDFIRVVLEGAFCEQPPLELLEAMEDAGCYVLDDDLLLGMRWYERPIAEGTADPLAALAAAYLESSPACAVLLAEGDDRVRRFADRVQALRADGVFFAAA